MLYQVVYVVEEPQAHVPTEEDKPATVCHQGSVTSRVGGDTLCTVYDIAWQIIPVDSVKEEGVAVVAAVHVRDSTENDDVSTGDR